ncbi:MAG: phenylalanine--tRNA ligase subunit beta [Chitinispirillia bacterium]|nr:phenylalanine--tRNA ligase subunit beta [Chitinispirillia bacterium]MCL2269189.1 phenylalanine--tRNA ligase subunit beta [Chitinispirillia bacterium]
MKILYSWLKDFVDITAPAHEVANALTSAGIEVASVTEVSIPQGVRVARVVSRVQHPNADKLSLCKVDAGDGGEPLQIVCGAPNVAEGLTVALATVGTQMAPDFKIGKAKLRGVESFGMICSEKELGLSDNHAGIMSLPADYKVGAPLSDYIPYDAVIEIEITPNRGDCLSVLGVAREVSARFGVPLKNTAKRPQERTDDPISAAISVNVESESRCPRYLGRLVRGVTIAPSPEWMQRRLTLAGLRPINNVVDITNYILIQYGQPMHAFDYNSISDKKIHVKTAESAGAANFTTLDGVERKLAGDDLLICDGKRPVALAGVMGGAGSEITEATKDVFLECAFFEQGGIRKTSKRLGLSTDSSYRFERGVDPAQGLADAIDTAASLMAELAGGNVSGGMIDTHPKPFDDKVITLRPSRTGKIIGVEFPAENITLSLKSLGIKCLKQKNDLLTCTVPLFRHDIQEEADLIEEVGRQYGYDSIKPSTSANVDLVRQPSTAEINRDAARHALCYFGLNEVMTNSMVSESKRKSVTPDIEPVKILNPLNPDMAEMRTSMAISLLETIAYNLNRKNVNNRIFEIGKVFRPDPKSNLADERDILAVAAEGSCFPQSWGSPAVQNDFFVLKGILEAFAAHCGLEGISFAKMESAPLYGNERAAVTIKSASGAICGTMGRVSDQICKSFGIKSAVFYAELDLTAWLSAPKPLPEYAPLPKFPALERDFCFVMPEPLSAAEVCTETMSASPLIKAVRPFDVYRGEKLAAGTKSVAFSVEFRSPEKTLTDADVAEACGKIISVMEKKHGAALRK